jgi:hypothetical protein
MILAGFVLGLSVRKVSEALLPTLGRPISPATVSTVARGLDAVVTAFHARPLKDHYRLLMLDGVVLARRRHPPARAGRPWSARRRQEGGHRLPPGAERERGRMGVLSRRPDPPRPGRR